MLIIANKLIETATTMANNTLPMAIQPITLEFDKTVQLRLLAVFICNTKFRHAKSILQLKVFILLARKCTY